MTTLVIVIIVVVVAVALIAAAMLVRQSRERIAQQRREHAEGLRASAGQQHADVEQARLEAELAERRAAEAEQGRAQAEARQEDQLREADRLDPDVDHRADDYRPTEPSGPATGTQGEGWTGSTGQQPPAETRADDDTTFGDAGGTHRA